MLQNQIDFKVWFREDIARVLDGVRAASAALPPVERAGFDLALESVARVIGITPQQFTASSRALAALPVARVIDGQPDY